MLTFREYYLIDLEPDKVRVVNLKTGDSRTSGPGMKFSNDRLLVTSAVEPNATIRRFVEQLSPNYFFRPRRVIIVNARHPNIPKFEDTEKMILRDIGAQVGSEVYLSFEKELNHSEIDLNRLSLRFEL